MCHFAPSFLNVLKLPLSLLISIGCFFISCGEHDDGVDEEYVFPVDHREDDSSNNSNSNDEGENKNNPIVFSELKVGEITDVIYSARNFLIEDKTKNGKQYLRISSDLGKTWKELENPYGDLVYFHIFSTGDMLFSTTKWCYYIDSGLTAITPSEVYDYDGSPFSPNAKEHFYQVGSCKNFIWKVDGTEIIAWGDYNLERTDPEYVARVWYSADFGRTVKCAIRFDKTKIDGKVINCRHTHGVRFDKYEETFYVMTGDAPQNSQLIRGKYNAASDSWNFHRIGIGRVYKLGSIYFDSENAYLITDYTDKEITQSGIIRCMKDSLEDSSKFEYLYKNEENRPLLCCEFDMNGNKVLMPDGGGAGFIYYTRDNYQFVKIPTNKRNRYIEGFTSPNYAGDVYAGFMTSFPYTLFHCFNYTAAMRNSGVKDFMVIKDPKPEYFDEDFFFAE